MSAIVELTGQRFGLVVAIERAGSDRQGYLNWRVRCDCGATRVLRGYSLRKQPPRTHRSCVAKGSP